MRVARKEATRILAFSSWTGDVETNDEKGDRLASFIAVFATPSLSKDHPFFVFRGEESATACRKRKRAQNGTLFPFLPGSSLRFDSSSNVSIVAFDPLFAFVRSRSRTTSFVRALMYRNVSYGYPFFERSFRSRDPCPFPLFFRSIVQKGFLPFRSIRSLGLFLQPRPETNPIDIDGMRSRSIGSDRNQREGTEVPLPPSRSSSRMVNIVSLGRIV